jgi:rfaE bifunctional protein nucleotidyltransferase chain/domain
VIPENIFENINSALPIIEKWKAENLKLALTNGCFDLFHKGHVDYLKFSSAKADRLIVGLNSDISVKKIKGNDRPIQDQLSRATVLSSNMFVDMVILFDDSTPINLIKAINPHIIIKGGDYEVEEMIGKDYVNGYGGQILITPFVEGYSSSLIIDKIKGLES